MLDLLRYCAKISGRVNNSKMERMGRSLIICKAQVHLQGKPFCCVNESIEKIEKIKEAKKEQESLLHVINEPIQKNLIKIDVLHMCKYLEVLYTYKRTFNHRILLDFWVEWQTLMSLDLTTSAKTVHYMDTKLEPIYLKSIYLIEDLENFQTLEEVVEAGVSLRPLFIIPLLYKQPIPKNCISIKTFDASLDKLSPALKAYVQSDRALLSSLINREMDKVGGFYVFDVDYMKTANYKTFNKDLLIQEKSSYRLSSYEESSLIITEASKELIKLPANELL